MFTLPSSKEPSSLSLDPLNQKNEKNRRKRLLLFSIPLLGILLVLGGSVLYLIDDHKTVKAAFILGRKDQTIRTLPQDEGGQQILEQDATLYEDALPENLQTKTSTPRPLKKEVEAKPLKGKLAHNTTANHPKKKKNAVATLSTTPEGKKQNKKIQKIWTLQLASLSSREAALSEWENKQLKRPELFEGYLPHVSQSKIGDKLYYRLSIRPLLDKKQPKLCVLA